MIRLLYNLLFPIGLLVFLPAYLLKMRRRGNYRNNFGQRLGLYDAGTQARLAQLRAATWIHAVSVGEVAIALKLAAKMRELDSDFTCVLTTTTPTGFAIATEQPRDWMQVMYNPIDFLPVVRRAFQVIRPVRVVLVEAEVWPNLAAEARRCGIPLALVNARLSPRSERRFQRFRALVAPTFRCLDLICVQEANDAKRWEALGVLRDRIRHVGSIKYDPTTAQTDAALPTAILREFGIDAAATPVLFGGSTHAGEEEILARVFRECRAEFPSLVLIIAPRHVERTRDIVMQLERLGLRIALRSAAGRPGEHAPDCLLLDTTGELRNWYGVATVVFMGKSLSTRGGQNPVEPILAGKPVLFGPHMENFATLARTLIEQNGAVAVSGADALAARCAELLRDRQAREQVVANAQEVLAAHRGATQRTAELLRALASHPHAAADSPK